MTRDPASTPRRLLDRALRFGPGLVEQGSLSALNFASIALLGRSLDEHAFADYVAVYAAITFPFMISSALWANITLIFLPKRYADAPRAYGRGISAINAVTAATLAALMLLAFHVLVRPISPAVGLGAALATLGWSNYDCRRRLAYAAGHGRRLLAPSLTLVVVYIAAIAALGASNRLNASTAFLALAAAYASAASLAAWTLRTQPRDASPLPERFRGVIAAHWRFARWALLGNLAYFIASQGYFLLGGRLLSDADLGGLRAAHNLLNVVSIVIVAFENAMVPRASGILHRDGLLELHRFVDALYARAGRPFAALAGLAGGAAAVAFWVLYRHRYGNDLHLIPIFAAYQLALLFASPVRMAWDAQERPDVGFLGHGAAAVVSSTVGVLLILRAGATGAALGFLLSGVTLTTVLYVALRRQRAVLDALPEPSSIQGVA